MKYSTKILFCLLQYSFILFVSCNEFNFNMEVLPSNYSWNVSLKCSDCILLDNPIKSTLPYQNGLTFNLNGQSKKIKQLQVTIRSEGKIEGHERKQTWILFPKRENSNIEGNYYNFDKLHQFRFGQFETDDEQGLYLNLKVKNATTPVDKAIIYVATIKDYDDYEDIEQKLDDDESYREKQIKLYLKGKKQKDQSVTDRIKTILQITKQPKICVAQMFECGGYNCNQLKGGVCYKPYNENSLFCENCKKKTRGIKPYRYFYEPIKLPKTCLTLDNLNFQNGTGPEFTYTLDFNKKQKKININYVKLVDIPTEFNPVDTIPSSSVSKKSKYLPRSFSLLINLRGKSSLGKQSEDIGKSNSLPGYVQNEESDNDEGEHDSYVSKNDSEAEEESDSESDNKTESNDTIATPRRNGNEIAKEENKEKILIKQNTMPIPKRQTINSSSSDSDSDVKIPPRRNLSFNRTVKAKPPMPGKNQSVARDLANEPSHSVQPFNTFSVPAPYGPYTTQGNFGNTSDHGHNGAGYHGNGLFGYNGYHMQLPNNNSALLHPPFQQTQPFQGQHGATSSFGHYVAGHSHDYNGHGHFGIGETDSFGPNSVGNHGNGLGGLYDKLMQPPPNTSHFQPPFELAPFNHGTDMANSNGLDHDHLGQFYHGTGIHGYNSDMNTNDFNSLANQIKQHNKEVLSFQEKIPEFDKHGNLVKLVQSNILDHDTQTQHKQTSQNDQGLEYSYPYSHGY